MDDTLNKGRIVERFKVKRKLKKDTFARTVPKWAHHLAFGFYGEQGWKCADQNRRGATVATGEWGEYLFLLDSGEVACTRYPQGYLAAYPGYRAQAGEKS